MALSQFISGNPAPSAGPVQCETGDRRAVVHQPRAIRYEKRDARRAAIAQEPRPADDTLAHVIDTGDARCPLRLDSKKLGRGTIRVLAQHALLDGGEPVGNKGFDASIERPGFASGINARLNEPQEFIENGILECDGQRENSIEPALDRREVVGQRPVLFEFEACALAEIGKANAGKLAGMKEVIPAGQRLTGVFAFEIVGGIVIWTVCTAPSLRDQAALMASADFALALA